MHNKVLSIGLLGSLLVALSGCTAPRDNAPATAGTTGEAMQAQAGDWEVLFGGDDLSQWRGYRRQDVPGGWGVEDGTLAFTPGGERGDIMTREQFDNFELEYDWKIAEGGNSGVMYRVSEDEQTPWRTGPEMQVLDDERHPDRETPSHRAGALYDLMVPPAGAVRPAGEWNSARIVARGNHIEHWLNGVKMAEVELGSEEWNRLLAASKFSSMPRFAKNPTGHIALQDHGDKVWYRNIRIRRLGADG